MLNVLFKAENHSATADISTAGRLPFFKKCLILFFVVLSANPLASAKPETPKYQDIIKKQESLTDGSDRSESAKLVQLCNEFLKKFPASSKGPEIHLIASNHDESPVTAVSHCEAVIKSAANSQDKLKAYITICSTMYLTSRFEECADYSKKYRD